MSALPQCISVRADKDLSVSYVHARQTCRASCTEVDLAAAQDSLGRSLSPDVIITVHTRLWWGCHTGRSWRLQTFRMVGQAFKVVVNLIKASDVSSWICEAWKKSKVAATVRVCDLQQQHKSMGKICLLITCVQTAQHHLIIHFYSDTTQVDPSLS